MVQQHQRGWFFCGSSVTSFIPNLLPLSTNQLSREDVCDCSGGCVCVLPVCFSVGVSSQLPCLQVGSVPPGICDHLTGFSLPMSRAHHADVVGDTRSAATGVVPPGVPCSLIWIWRIRFPQWDHMNTDGLRIKAVAAKENSFSKAPKPSGRRWFWNSVHLKYSPGSVWSHCRKPGIDFRKCFGFFFS